MKLRKDPQVPEEPADCCLTEIVALLQALPPGSCKSRKWELRKPSPPHLWEARISLGPFHMGKSKEEAW